MSERRRHRHRSIDAWQKVASERDELRAQLEGYKNGNVDLHNENQALRAESDRLYKVIDALEAHIEELEKDYDGVTCPRVQCRGAVRTAREHCVEQGRRIEALQDERDAMLSVLRLVLDITPSILAYVPASSPYREKGDRVLTEARRSLHVVSLDEAQRLVDKYDCEKLSWADRDSGEQCHVDRCSKPVKWQINDSPVRLCWLCSGCG